MNVKEIFEFCVKKGIEADPRGKAVVKRQLEREKSAYQKMDKEETFRNLDRIVGQIRRHGAMVVLLEIRIGLLRDEYLGGYKRIAETHGALLIANFMSGILGSARLTSDGLHPNAEGHEIIAERVLEKIVPILEAADELRAGKRPSS